MLTRIFHWALIITIAAASASGATFVVTKAADTNDGVDNFFVFKLISKKKDTDSS